MGGCKIDLHSAERQFYRVTFSDTDCIKGLIVGRSNISPYHGEVRNFNIYEAGNVKPLNQELICIYADLDNLIDKAKLNNKQTEIVNMLMNGYETSDIAIRFNQSTKKIENILDTISKKIKKENDLSWKYDDVYINYVKVKWEYKKCTKCEESFPMIEEFFSQKSDSKDGFHPYCKKCR